MGRDAETTYAVEEAITAPAKSANYLKHGPSARDLGVGGRTVFLVGVVTEEMDDAGDDSILGVKIETDEEPAFGTATASALLLQFPANSIVGTRKFAAIPPELLDEEYSRLDYSIVSGGNLSAGKFTFYLTNDISHFTAYPDARTLDPQH